MSRKTSKHKHNWQIPSAEYQGDIRCIGCGKLYESSDGPLPSVWDTKSVTNMTRERFSKANLSLRLFNRFIDLANRHHFSLQSGYAQVEGKKTATIVAFGEWSTCYRLLNEIDGWNLIPSGTPEYNGPSHKGDPRDIVD